MTAQPIDFTALAREWRISLDDGQEYETDAEVEATFDEAATAFARRVYAAGRAEGLEEAAKDINELLSEADPLNFADLSVRAAWQDRAWAILKKWRAVASSDPAPRDQVAEEDQHREPPGGNFYRPHTLMIDSSTFWRCKHGITGLGKDQDECKDCAADDPAAYRSWHGLPDPAPAHPVEPGLAAQEVERLRKALENLLFCLESKHRLQYPEWDGAAEPASAIGKARAALSAPRPAQTKGPTE